MIILRQGKAKNILESAIDSVLTAVEAYNNPRGKFRLENYIILMILGWTKLFHAYFQSSIGGKYFYKGKDGRYVRIDGEKKAWELKECIKRYQKKHGTYKEISKAIMANLIFFINIRNKIEHRYWEGSSLNIILFGECQSLLYNFENLLSEIFGDTFAINGNLAFSLQLSHLRAKEQFEAQHKLMSKDLSDIFGYVEKYKNELDQETYDSQEYSVKLLQIPKISNTNRSDLAVEFVNWDALNEEDKENYKKLNVIIKNKIVSNPVFNYSLLRPSKVLNLVEQKTGVKITMTNHTILWKAFKVRPLKDAKSKSNTNKKYCLYDEPHNDYLYTTEWVEFISRLVTKFKFSNDNIKLKCSENLKIEMFEA